MTPKNSYSVPGGTATKPRACQQCRASKIKCDMMKPTCKSCFDHARICEYSDLPPKQRPSKALIRAAETNRRALESLLIKLKKSSEKEREQILASYEVVDNSIKVQEKEPVEALDPNHPDPLCTQRPDRCRDEGDDLESLSDDEQDALITERAISQFLSVDEHGQFNVFGPTSALHNPVESCQTEGYSLRNLANQLFVNATLQRQFESTIWSFNDIDGVPIELATHLHDLHWNRQHHSFLLTYRPAYTRDLISGGQYWSKFLSNAIFASVSKFPNRPEVRDDPDDPRTSGGRFLRRCEELLLEESPFEKSSIPTVIGLMLLSSTFLARGEVSKSWKYCGLAIRMMFDLGLHLDYQRPGLSAEDMEIRRRVFWGIFICDKLQSLYLGRPVTVQLRDAYVSCEFMDTLEENEPWTPYIDPNDPNEGSHRRAFAPTPLHSVTCFQQLCELSKLMTKIVSRFYVAGARIRNAEQNLQNLSEALRLWRVRLSDHLAFDPGWDSKRRPIRMLAPNIILMNTTYHSLIILLHRPFISNSHLHKGSPSKSSWHECTIAATAITSIMTAYRTAYTLRGAPYLASYACYVACTIHVRNAALGNETSRAAAAARDMLETTMQMLNDLSESSPCTRRASQIILRLMEANHLQRNAVPATEEISPSLPWDVDAIMRMFPSTLNASTIGIASSDLAALPEWPQCNQIGTDAYPLMHDPLFGFMDGFDMEDVCL